MGGLVRFSVISICLSLAYRDKTTPRKKGAAADQPNHVKCGAEVCLVCGRLDNHQGVFRLIIRNFRELLMIYYDNHLAFVKENVEIL